VDFASDLALCAACLRGDAESLKTLDGLLKDAVGMARRGVQSLDADELQQTLRQKLVVARDGQVPKLQQYTGRGPLLAWLRAVAAREAISATRRVRPGSRDLDGEENALVAPDAELQFIRAKYQAPFKAGFRAAVAALSTDQRHVLRLHFVEGLSHEEIGRLEKVHQSTVTRRLAAAREALLEKLQEQLAHDLKLDAGELQSLVRAVRSDLALSLSALFPRKS